MYQLKKGQEAFTIVDGPDAGKTFNAGTAYPVTPIGYTDRFEKIKTTTAARPQRTAKAGKE